MQIENRVSMTVKNRIALVQLNRPGKHNALDLEMFRAVAKIQKKLGKERDVRAVVLAGSGVDIRILAGSNQGIAVRRQLGDVRDYRRVGRW